MDNQPVRSVDKANDYAIEGLKHIITISSGVLAVTVTFVKDLVLGYQHPFIVIGFLFVCWLLLVLSIVFAYFAIVEAAYSLDLMDGEALFIFSGNPRKGITFPPETDEQKTAILNKLVGRRRRSRQIAFLAQWAFSLGMVFLVIFGFSSLLSARGFQPENSQVSKSRELTSTPVILPTLMVTPQSFAAPTITNPVPTENLIRQENCSTKALP